MLVASVYVNVAGLNALCAAQTVLVTVLATMVLLKLPQIWTV